MLEPDFLTRKEENIFRLWLVANWDAIKEDIQYIMQNTEDFRQALRVRDIYCKKLVEVYKQEGKGQDNE